MQRVPRPKETTWQAASARPKLVGRRDGEAVPHRRNRVNLFELAYERIEELIVNCELKPGRFLAIQDLQEITGFSRTPVHQAVSRLADDTLILVRPRHGLQIAPIDLARERVLLHLRRDIERFVIRLATERAGPSHRNQCCTWNACCGKTRNADARRVQWLDRRIDRWSWPPRASRSSNTRCARCTHLSAIGCIHHSYMPGQTELSTARSTTISRC